MRRSLRDSIVGFSLLGGILIFTFFSFWLRGVKLSSKNWYLFAEFNNASGLSKKSPVSYRGILVGSIEDILFTNESIKAKIVLNNPEIILPKPAFARVVTNSFLGGDVQVALETSEKTLPKDVAKAGLVRIISGLFKTIFALIDSLVNKISSIDPTKIPL